jgi:TPR repeat protein
MNRIRFILLIMLVSLATALPIYADRLDGMRALARGEFEVAIKEFLPLAKEGDQDATLALGYAYEQLLIETRKNRGDSKAVADAAIRELEPLAQAQNKEAQYRLAYIYGFLSDEKEKFQWLLRAATQEHAMAQWELGNMYEIGSLTPTGRGSFKLDRDYYEARKWFEKSANNGENLGMESLGRLYANGEGVTKNFPLALAWFQKAIDKGNDGGALTALGSMYETGKGVPKNQIRANELYKKAAALGDRSAKRLVENQPLADKGNADAQYHIAEMWLGGHGVVEDIDKALSLLNKAADSGQVQAIERLGHMYREGWKVPQDYVEAHKWYNIAASLGDDRAKYERDALTKLMTPSQIAEAQKLAREWMERRTGH